VCLRKKVGILVRSGKHRRVWVNALRPRILRKKKNGGYPPWKRGREGGPGSIYSPRASRKNETTLHRPANKGEGKEKVAIREKGKGRFFLKKILGKRKATDTGKGKDREGQ